MFGVHRSFIRRELKHNSQDGTYHYDTVHAQTISHALFNFVKEKRKLRWSPVQISGWLKKNNLGGISHETIYKYLWEDKKREAKEAQEECVYLVEST